MHPSTPVSLYRIIASSDTATAPASRPAGDPYALHTLQYAILGLGALLLIGWLVRSLSRPRKFGLADAPGRKNNLTPVHVLGIFILCYLFAKTGSSFLAEMHEVPETRAIILGGIAGRVLAIAAIMVMAAYTFKNGLFRGLGFSGRHCFFDSIRAVAAYLMVFPACFLLLVISVWIAEQVAPGFEKIHTVLKPLSTAGPGWIAIILISSVLLTPLYEELFFRGLLQSLFRRHLGPWPSIVLSSALFGLAHFPLPHTIAPLAALGVALGYNYERTGRLWAPIVTHGLFNLVSVFVYLDIGAG